MAGRLLDNIIAKLNGRIVAMVRKFFGRMPSVLRGEESMQQDAASSVWEGLLEDESPVGEGFAEQRFVLFVHGKLVDFLRTELTQERGSVLLSQLSPENVEEEAVAFEDNQAADVDDQPENEAQRNELRDRLTRMMGRMPKKEKLAVYFRLEQGYDWERTARFMNCSVPTARKYYALGVKRLQGELDDGLEND